jgi:WD40 repeat protein
MVMITRSASRGESSSGALKRQATSAPAPLDEDPLVPSSTQEHDASSVPSMLPNLIAALILPFVQDRPTWNSVCCANKELREAGKRMRPPWPNTVRLNSRGRCVSDVAFSPCKSFLVCGSLSYSNYQQNVVHVWDRHGEHYTRLEGHTAGVTCLQYSFDGKYLASGSSDRSIRLWRVTSESAAHSSSSDESRNHGTSRGTLHAQTDIILLGHRDRISAMDFSPTDSNILASGCWAGDIKLWDVINQVCIHAFDPQLSAIRAIFFSPGDNIQFYVVTSKGPMIRIVRNNRMEFASTILEPSLGNNPRVAFSPCGTRFAAISDIGIGNKQELALFDLRTMAKTQSVSVFLDARYPGSLGGIAMSPDGKKLAITNTKGEIRLIECHDLTIQKHVDTIEQQRQQRRGEGRGLWPVTFDPTSRVFAVGCLDGRVELRTI